MEPIKIYIAGAKATVLHAPVITAGMVKLPVEFSFDSDWDGMAKNVVFRAGGVSRVKSNIDTHTTVSAEVMDVPGFELEIGVFGTKEDGTALPTVWACVGTIQEGAKDAAVEAVDPEQPVWAQALDKLGKVDQQIQEALMEAKDSGEFDGPQGEQGPPGPDGIGIEMMEIDASGMLIATYTNGASVMLGKVVGEGKAGTGANSVIMNGGEPERATGNHSFVANKNNLAKADSAFASGNGTEVTAWAGNAQNYRTTVTGLYGSARNNDTLVSGESGDASGWGTKATNICTRAAGRLSEANGPRSSVDGLHTIANSREQHVYGRYNVPDSSNKYVNIVGNGSSDANRSNAYTLDWQGNGWFAGKVTAGADPAEDMDLVPLHIMREALQTAAAKTLVWENASPTSSFSSQTIELDLSEYDSIEILCFSSKQNTQVSSGTLSLDLGGSAYMHDVDLNDDSNLLTRQYGISRTGVQALTAFHGVVANNFVLVPYRIYAIKGVGSL